MNNQQVIYKIEPNFEKMIVLWEHTDSTGIKRHEAAIVNAEMAIENIRYIQTAFDQFFGADGGHSRIIMQRIHTVSLKFAHEQKEYKK